MRHNGLHKGLLCLTTLLVLGLGSVASAQDKPKFSKEHTGKIPWVMGFEEGLAEAKWSGRPMMVFFTAVW